MTIKRNALMMAAYVNVKYLQVLQEHVSFGVQTTIDCTNTSQKVSKIDNLLYPNCLKQHHQQIFFKLDRYRLMHIADTPPLTATVTRKTTTESTIVSGNIISVSYTHLTLPTILLV